MTCLQLQPQLEPHLVTFCSYFLHLIFSLFLQFLWIQTGNMGSMKRISKVCPTSVAWRWLLDSAQIDLAFDGTRSWLNWWKRRLLESQSSLPMNQTYTNGKFPWRVPKVPHTKYAPSRLLLWEVKKWLYTNLPTNRAAHSTSTLHFQTNTHLNLPPSPSPPKSTTPTYPTTTKAPCASVC